MTHKIILLKIINFIGFLSFNNFKVCIFTFYKKYYILKKVSLFLLVLSVNTIASAQYYYKDIISNKQLVADMSAYKENKVRTIAIKSFEDNGEESEGFFCEKKISKDYKKTELFTRADIADASLFTSKFDATGKLLGTNDSSALSVTEIRYSYDAQNRISSIFSTIRAITEDDKTSITEEHIYTYENNMPSSMIKVKNGRDSTTILFSKDENGNIAVEKDTKSGTKFYYYYDAKKRLTDIVQASEYSKNLKPDYMFEYNNAGLITQMTSIEEGSSNYFVWKYSYDNGMRIKEKCFTNERRLMGSIEYEYK
jgi:YD repeat-containing protein